MRTPSSCILDVEEQGRECIQTFMPERMKTNVRNSGEDKKGTGYFIERE